jgi:hypothetical protein
MEASISPKTLDWVKISQDWKESGLNQRDFCRERGYSYGRFKAARAKLGLTRPKKKSQKRPEVGTPPSSVLNFLPLTVEPEPTLSTGPLPVTKTGPKVELELPFGVVLRFYEVESAR